MKIIGSKWCLLRAVLVTMLGLANGYVPRVQAAPEPAGWYTGDIHVHRSCGGSPTSIQSIYNDMVSQDLNVISLLADMGNGEVLDPVTDLPKVTGQDDPISTPGRIVHWDAEWHWDAIYNQFPHQALGGHILALGITNATQIWNESTYPILNWAKQQGGIAGFAHFQYLDDNIPQTLTCCTPIEYPVEVALGACDFISEDVNGSESFIRSYYRLLNCGFRPGFAAGSDHPCAASIGTMLTYSQVAGGQLTYRNWINGLKNGRTVVSRNGRREFLDLKVNNTAGPGDQINLASAGSVQVNVQWLATQNLTGTIELVQNGVVVASQSASVSSGSPATLSTTVNFTKSGWLAARRMDASGHQVHTAAMFVIVGGEPVRASASDAQFYVQWIDTLLQNTAVGGVWASYYPTGRTAAHARYNAAKAIFQQIAVEAGATPLPQVSIGNGIDGGSTDYLWFGGPWINAGRFLATSNMTVTTMQAKVAGISGKYKCAIYTDSAGQPSRLLRSTVEVSGPGTGWQAFPLTASQTLTNGQYYWLAIWSDDANAQVFYSDNNGTLRWGQQNYGNWPDPMTTSGGGPLNYCIFATGSGSTGTLTNIVVTPATPTILAGATQQFTATGAYSDGTSQNISSQAIWVSSNTSVATVSFGGLASGVSAGTATISATLSGKTGSATLTVQAAPLSISTTSLPDGVVNSAYSTVIAAAGGTTPYTWSVISGALPPGLTLNAGSGAITGTPTSTGAFNFTAQVRDSSNPIQTVTRAFALNILAVSPAVTIWPNTTVPGVVDAGADSPVELGVKFRSDVAGSVTGVRFYKASANTGTHVGRLWTSSGVELGSATFNSETGSGWQQALFPSPIPITANTVYVISYHTTVGHYSQDVNYFATVGVDNPPLHALANGVSGDNGTFAYGPSGTFPNQPFNAANNWVDVVFQAGTAPTLTNIVVTPPNPSRSAGTSQQFTATGSYSDGSTQNLTGSVTWTSSNTAVATNSGGGLMTAVGVGNTTISATFGSISGGTTLTVTNAATLASIAVTPANPTILIGGTQQFTATGTYSDSSTQNLTSLATWISSNAAVATVSAGGLASGVSTGATTIAAVMSGVVGNTTLTVNQPPAGLGDYRSAGTGLWSSAATWQTNNGTTWVTASLPPNNSATAGVVTIRAGHTVTVSAATTVDQVVVQTGGQITVTNVTLTVANGTGTDLDVFGNVVLVGTSGAISVGSGAGITFKSGSVYQHARTTGTIPTATWDTNATCLITGITSALPGGLGQAFGHFTWNCTGQTSALNLETAMNVAGNFTVSSTGSSTLRVANGSAARVVTVTGDFIQTAGTFVVASGTAAGTLNVGGNFNLGGGTFILKDSSGAGALNVAGDFSQAGGLFDQRAASTTSTATVTVTRHFNLSSGTFDLSGVGAVGTLNVGGNFTHTGGTLTETSSGSGAVVFTSGMHTNLSGGTVSGAIHFTVNSGATLMLGTSLLGNGSSGTFTLAAGGTLGIGDPAGITASGATGNIRVTGARSYNSGASYLYNGTVAQVPGNGLPATVNNLTVANPVGLTLNTTNTVTGSAQVSASGRLLGTGRINTGPLLVDGEVSPGTGVGRLTTAREIWSGGASYAWELNNAAGAPGVGWDLLSLTDGQGIDLQAASTNAFVLKLISLNGGTPGMAANFTKTNSYLWTIAVATNAAITNFAPDRLVLDTTRFSNDFGAGTFSVEQAGSELRLRFTGEPVGLTITTTALSNALHNVAHSATLTAVGGLAPYTWSISSGALPTGLVLNAANGNITGTPSVVGTFNFTVGVSDASSPIQNATKPFSVTVAPVLTSIVVSPANPAILVGGAQQFIATGDYSDGSAQNITGQATWTSSSTSVATVNASGLATAAAAGTTTITAGLSGVTGSTLLSVQAPLVITTASLPSGTVNSAYTTTLVANGGTPPYTWALGGGSLPPGLTLNPTGGAISGTPTVSGTSNLVVQVTDASVPIRTNTKPLSITIAPALASIAVTPVNPTNVVGTTRQFTATGAYSDGSTQNVTSLATWASSSTTVATINSGGLATGVSVGTTTISATVGSISGGTTLKIQPQPLTITTTSLAAGTVGTPYNTTLAVSGGTTPYVWSLASGSLPPGLALSAGGVISGTPTVAGISNFVVRVTDAGTPSQVATNLLTLTINTAGGPPGIFGNTTDGNLTDALWFGGPWINAGRFQASSNMSVSTIQAKVVGITGKYKCAIYTDSGSQPNQLLRATTEISNPTTGWQSLPLTSSVVLTNGQFYWLAIWSDNANAQIYYSGTDGTLRWQQLNYGNWPEPMATTGGGNNNYCIYATGLGSVTLGVASVSPADGTSGVSLGVNVGATFTADMDPSTINTTTVALRDPSGSLVSATVSFNSGTRTVTLTPGALLKPAATYTATIKGGLSGVTSLAGARLVGDYSWNFTTDIYGDGPGGPILIVTQTTNAFSKYYAEILLTEGLNAFALTNVSAISAASLANYDVVVLGQTALTPAQVTTLSNWVGGGGKLIAMRPDKQLAGLLGLVDAGTTLSEGYVLVNTTNGPGVGIVGETIQFHGTADRYTLGSATRVATLYSSATAATVNPAVTLRNVGANGGQAAAFTYDLARSIILTRQGNPGWVGQDRDGISPLRSDDLFYGAASFDPQPDWVNLNKVAIPQADEQQRLLANLILTMNSNKKLLPRFWYFPHGYPAVVVMTGDDHGNNGTAGRFNQYLAATAPGASVADWEAIRGASYLFPYTPMTDAQAASYNTAGFELGLHLNTGCGNYTAETLDGYFFQQLSELNAAFPSLPTPTTLRVHCIAWSGYTILPEVCINYGIRLDTSYYYYPPSWVANRPGMFTGSGMPMRFAATNGTTINVFQAATQMTDESDQSYPFTIDTLLDRALGPEGYYGSFVANMHTDANTPTTPGQIGSDAILASAQSRGVPIITPKQLLTWLDARNSSKLTSITWSGNTQSFSVEADAAARGLSVMVPVPAGYNVSEVRLNGSPTGYSLTLVKGLRYAFFTAGTGNYQVGYSLDSTPPSIVSVSPANGATGVSPTAEIRVNFNEALDASTVNSGTIVLYDAAANPVSAAVSYNPATHSAVLQPAGSLLGLQTYTIGVQGGSGGVKDFAGNPLANNFISTFTTVNQTSYNIWNANSVPGLVDGGADSPVQLGIKFQSDLAGYITGIRFYKANANTGTHVGGLWTGSGTQLATATFINESASGWQQVNFATPVAISANTVYVASYHTTVGHYSADINYFASVGVDNGPLHALSSGVSGGNGVYAYGTSTVFPNQTWNAANYWVDVVFQITPP